MSESPIPRRVRLVCYYALLFIGLAYQGLLAGYSVMGEVPQYVHVMGSVIAVLAGSGGLMAILNTPAKNAFEREDDIYDEN